MFLFSHFRLFLPHWFGACVFYRKRHLSNIRHSLQPFFTSIAAHVKATREWKIENQMSGFLFLFFFSFLNENAANRIKSKIRKKKQNCILYLNTRRTFFVHTTRLIYVLSAANSQNRHRKIHQLNATTYSSRVMLTNAEIDFVSKRKKKKKRNTEQWYRAQWIEFIQN